MHYYNNGVPPRFFSSQSVQFSQAKKAPLDTAKLLSQSLAETVLGKRDQCEPSAKPNSETVPKKRRTHTVEKNLETISHSLTKLLFNPESEPREALKENFEFNDPQLNESIESTKIGTMSKHTFPITQAPKIQEFDMQWIQYDLDAKRTVDWGKKLPVGHRIALLVNNKSPETMEVKCTLMSNSCNPIVLEKLNDVAPAKKSISLLTFTTSDPASRIKMLFEFNKPGLGSQKYMQEKMSTVSGKARSSVPKGEKEFVPAISSQKPVQKSVVKMAQKKISKPSNLVFFDVATREVIEPVNKDISVIANRKIGMRLQNPHTESIKVCYSIKAVDHTKLAEKNDVQISKKETRGLCEFTVPDYVPGKQVNFVLVKCFVKEPFQHPLSVILDIIPKSKPDIEESSDLLPVETTEKSSISLPETAKRLPKLLPKTTVMPPIPLLSARLSSPSLPTTVSSTSSSDVSIVPIAPHLGSPSKLSAVRQVNMPVLPTETTPVMVSISFSDRSEGRAYDLGQALKSGHEIIARLKNNNTVDITVVSMVVKDDKEVLSQDRITLKAGETKEVPSFTPHTGDNLTLNCMARFNHLPDSAPSWTVSYKVPLEIDLEDNDCILLD